MNSPSQRLKTDEDHSLAQTANRAPDSNTTPQPGAAENNRPQPSHKKKPWVIVVVIVVLVIAAVAVRRIWFSPKTGAATARDGNQPVPVVVGVAATKDVPIYLDGLGTVQAFNTVTVRSRVDGQLVKVAFTEGQEVKAGDVLAQIDAAPYQAMLDQATAKKAQDEAQLANARVDLQRYENLLKSDSITQQIYDTQKATIAQETASVAADEAAIESARVNLDYATIRSPIDGRVGIRQVDQGNIVHASDASGIVTLTQLRPISVVFTLPEQSLSQLNPQNDSAFEVLAVSRDNTNTLATGKLAVLDNQIDTTTGTIKLKANFPNDDLRLWPGQFVNTRLHLSTRNSGIVVPASVVQRGPDGAFAFVIKDDETVKMQPLKVAHIESGVALIDEGLAVGERVVVDGQYKLQDGSKVKPVDPAASSKSSSTNATAKPHPQGKKKP